MIEFVKPKIHLNKIYYCDITYERNYSSNASYYKTGTRTRVEESINNFIDEQPEEPEQPTEEATISLIDEQVEETEEATSNIIDEQPEEPEEPTNNRVNEATHNIIDEQPEEPINNIFNEPPKEEPNNNDTTIDI